MFHPVFSRRTLALILSCLVITLGGVGLLFVIYVFNETSSLLSGRYEKINYSGPFYEQAIIRNDDHKYEQIFGNQRRQALKENISAVNLFKKNNESELAYNKTYPIDINTKNTKITEVNHDTIYIDDFDRSAYKRKRKNEIGNIDYFDVILVDHKLDTKLHNVPNHSVKYKNINTFQENIVTNNILLRKDVETRKGNSEANINLLNTDSAGSGSGDYIDDTELSSIEADSFVAKSFQKKKIKKQYQWRPFEFYKKSVSSLSRFITPPYAKSNHFNGLVNRRDSPRKTFYPDFSPQVIAQIKTIPKTADKKNMYPSNFTRNEGIFYNGSLRNSSTSTHNDNDLNYHLRITRFGSTVDSHVVDSSTVKSPENDFPENEESWAETRTRRIMGNVKKSAERSRQLLLCEQAGGGELCRMLFKEHVNDY